MDETRKDWATPSLTRLDIGMDTAIETGSDTDGGTGTYVPPSSPPA